MNPMLAKYYLTPRVKNIVFVLLIITLLVSNLASLLSWRAHEVMYKMLSKTVSVLGEKNSQKVLFNSPKVQLELNIERRTNELSTKVAQFKTSNQNLKTENQNLKTSNQNLKTNLNNLNKTISTHKSKAKSAIQLIQKRIQKNITRNVVALPSEGVPAVSFGVGVLVTAMDIYDACETMKDFNSVLVAMGEDVVTDQSVCGVNMPSFAKLMSMGTSDGNSGLSSIIQDAKTYRLPTYLLPNLNFSKWSN